ncbi:MAG: hypothetical protein CMJ25_17265 [Phycisphaerae bacterium]|nr:hypothetical protein [Phycisphaerae bacterium]
MNTLITLLSKTETIKLVLFLLISMVDNLMLYFQVFKQKVYLFLLIIMVVTLFLTRFTLLQMLQHIQLKNGLVIH